MTKDCGINGTKVIDILINLLETWAHKPGFGVPQGPEASIFLSSAYLSKFDEKALSVGNELDFKIFRYNDDLSLMAKSPEILHQVIEILSGYLFDIFLDLNGKTAFYLLDQKEISKLNKRRIYSPYNDDEDSAYTLATIEDEVPGYLEKLAINKKLEQHEISALKYYLKSAKNKAYFKQLIDLLDKSHSFSLYICRYVQKFVDDGTVFAYLLNAYNKKHLYSWTKFWVLKTLISSKLFQNSKYKYDTKAMVLDSFNDKSWEIRALCLYVAEVFGFLSAPTITIGKYYRSAENIYEKSMTSYLLGNRKEYNSLSELLRNECVDLQIIAYSFLNKFELTQLPNDLSQFSQKLFNINDVEAKNDSNVQIPNSLLDLISESGAVHVTLDTSKLKKELGLTWNHKGSILKKSKQVAHWLEQKETGHIVMDGTYILSNPNVDSENWTFISYVISRSGKQITRKEINADSSERVLRPFNNILNDLGFKGEIKKLFFPKTGDDSVRFFCKIKYGDMKTMLVDEEKLKSQLKKLKRI
ncbi:RNA-directed DNA polymerase [candidate division WWE3 bacterium]|nr:RNA-directed DNA polymerase [candidate division WWE3 bacterium]